MTERAYRAAQALAAPGSGATPAERDNAAQRCREYEARHGQPKAQRRYRPGEYSLHIRCTRCGWDFASHCTAQSKGVHSVVCDNFVPRVQRYADPVLCRHCNTQWMVHDIVDLYTTRCPGFQPTERPGLPPLWAVCRCGHTEACHFPAGVPRARTCGGTNTAPGCCSCLGFIWALVPWWQLSLSKNGRPISPMVSEYRSAMRAVRKEVEESRAHSYVVRLGWGCYDVPAETAQRIEAGAVDWTDFPADETRHVWRPSAETRRAVAAWRKTRA